MVSNIQEPDFELTTRVVQRRGNWAVTFISQDEATVTFEAVGKRAARSQWAVHPGVAKFVHQAVETLDAVANEEKGTPTLDLMENRRHSHLQKVLNNLKNELAQEPSAGLHAYRSVRTCMIRMIRGWESDDHDRNAFAAACKEKKLQAYSSDQWDEALEAYAALARGEEYCWDESSDGYIPPRPQNLGIWCYFVPRGSQNLQHATFKPPFQDSVRRRSSYLPFPSKVYLGSRKQKAQELSTPAGPSRRNKAPAPAGPVEITKDGPRPQRSTRTHSQTQNGIPQGFSSLKNTPITTFIKGPPVLTSSKGTSTAWGAKRPASLESDEEDDSGLEEEDTSSGEEEEIEKEQDAGSEQEDGAATMDVDCVVSESDNNARRSLYNDIFEGSLSEMSDISESSEDESEQEPFQTTGALAPQDLASGLSPPPTSSPSRQAEVAECYHQSLDFAPALLDIDPSFNPQHSDVSFAHLSSHQEGAHHDDLLPLGRMAGQTTEGPPVSPPMLRMADNVAQPEDIYI